LNKPKLLRRGRTTIIVAVIAALAALAGTVAIAPSASAATGTSGNITFTVTPDSGLVSGQVINVSASASGGTTFTEIRAHICDPSISPVNAFNFSYQGSFCVTSVAANRTAGQFGANAVQNYEASKTFASVTSGALDTTAPGAFLAGTGTVTWEDELAHSPHTLTCDKSNSCAVVVRVQDNGSGAPHFFKAPITFAGTPGAPNVAPAMAGNGSVNLSWTPSADTGNGSIDHYTVSWTGPTSGSQDVAAPATTATINGLQNFGAYTFKVTTTIKASDGVTTFTSGDSNTVNATPAAGGPTNVQGTPADGAINLTWTAPSNTTGLTRYRVTPTDLDADPEPAPQFTTGTETNLTFGGLTNGHRYTFTVAAEYGPGQFTTESAPSGQLTPNGKFITQTITVTRPQGDLVLTQACSPLTPDPYPQDDTTGLVVQPPYPTDCTIALGAAKLIKQGPGAGQYFQATGTLHEVTVVDARDGDPGWTVNATMGQFNDGTKHFSGSDLGWDPSRTATPPFSSPDGDYTQEVSAGPTVAPATIGGMGSGVVALLGGNDIGPMATGHGGLGIAKLNAQLTLWIPIFAQAGNYTGVMTITAI
jgi:hypothetical protein